MKGLGFYDEYGLVIQNSENKKEGKHIIENIKRILMTRRGERIGDLSFGSDLRKYLFMSEMSIGDVIGEIKNSILRCEDRVEILDCSISGYDKNTEILSISLTLRSKSTGEIIDTKLSV